MTSIEDQLHELQDSYDEALDEIERLNNTIIDLTDKYYTEDDV